MMKFLLIIDGEIINPISKESSVGFYQKIFYYIDVINKTLIPVDFRALKTIVTYQTQDFAFIKESDINKAVLKLENALGKQVTDCLLSGNCEIISILNTPGGYGGYAKEIQKCLLYLRNKGALTKVFVFALAASAGFIICAAFEKKYCLMETEFMFHKGGIPKDFLLDEEIDEEDCDCEEEDCDCDDDELMLQVELDEMREHLYVFFSNCDKGQEEECEKLKEICIENHDADTYYSGEHLLRLGIVTDCPDSVSDLIKMLKEEIVIAPTPTGTIQVLLDRLENECNEIVEHGIFRFDKLGLNPVNESPHLRR